MLVYNLNILKNNLKFYIFVHPNPSLFTGKILIWGPFKPDTGNCPVVWVEVRLWGVGGLEELGLIEGLAR